MAKPVFIVLDQLSRVVTSRKGKISANKASIDAINNVDTGILANAKSYADGKIGTVEEGKTVVEMITSSSYDDTALKGRVSANETAITTLNGSGEGSVSKAIDDAFNDFATKVTDDGVVNSYKELIDYAAQHGSEFTALVGDVTELQTLVGEGYTIATSDQITALLAD